MSEQTATRLFSPPEAGALWSFLRHEFLILTWALAEVAVITPVLLAFSVYARYWSPGRVAVLFLLIMLIPFNIGRLCSAVGLAVDKQRILLSAGLLIVVFLAWRNLLYEPASFLDLNWLGNLVSSLGRGDNPYWTRALAIFIVMTILWWRGIALVGRSIDIGNAGLRLRAGLLIVAVLVAGVSAVQLPWPVTPFILLFLFASLVGIVLTRVEQLELGQSGHSFPLSLSWILIVFTAAASVVFVTGIVAALISGEAVQDLVGLLGPIWLALGFLATSVGATISLLSVPIIIVLSWILGLFVALFTPALEGVTENLQLTLPEPLPLQPAEELSQSPFRFAQDTRQILIILAMVFVVLFVSLALGRLFRFVREPRGLARDRLSPFDDLEMPEKPGLGRRLANRLGLFKRWRAAASIRRIYRQMCSAAASYGYARLPTETPFEYLASLSRAWPANTRESELITEAYVQVRYGEIPETKDELEAIAAAWKLLENARPAEKEISESGVRLGRD
jgi:hypothetical protein